MHLKKSSSTASATTTLMAERIESSDANDATLSSAGAEDAQMSSGDAAEQVQNLQTEVEQLHKALADADNAKMVLHAQNEQLQADLLARYV